MNWFTKEAVGSCDLAEKTRLVAEHGGCEHVQSNPETLHLISYENDSFGREGYCMCKTCAAEERNAELDEEYCCRYCKMNFKLRDGILWRWYDFYAPQGDEPSPVCNTCKDGEAHRLTVENDQAAAASEFGYD